MSELMTMEMSTTVDVSARMAHEVGVMAGRLARFLETTLRGSEGMAPESRAFLWAMFESVSEGRSLESWLRNPREHSVGHSVGADLCVCPEAADLRRPGQTHRSAPTPLDRLTRSLALSPEEVELLLIGGLCEENEGLGRYCERRTRAANRVRQSAWLLSSSAATSASVGFFAIWSKPAR